MRLNYDLDTLRGDVFGGVTSMVVALPVSLGFGIASGMGAAAGLYGAIAVGFFAAVFGGTRSQISGPTAPMSVAMAVVLTSHADSLAEALTVVVLAGFLQVLLGVSRIGRFVAYTPHVVISGFMSGIGVIILLMQALPLLGASGMTGGPIGAVQALPAAVNAIDIGAFAIGAVTLAVGFLWPRRFARFAPGPLVALAAGTALGVLWFTEAPVIGAIPVGLPSLLLGLPPAAFLLHALPPAIILALLGSVDSLLTSLVADSLTGKRHNPDRELIGQGIGNMAAGLIGALPGAGTTASTVTNIRSGGSTQLSGALVRRAPLRPGAGPRAAGRADSARRAGRGADQGRLGHRRLAHARPAPSPAARAPDRYAGDTLPHGVRGPDHRSRHRADRGRHGACPSAGTA